MNLCKTLSKIIAGLTLGYCLLTGCKNIPEVVPEPIVAYQIFNAENERKKTIDLEEITESPKQNRRDFGKFAKEFKEYNPDFGIFDVLKMWNYDKDSTYVDEMKQFSLGKLKFTKDQIIDLASEGITFEYIQKIKKEIKNFNAIYELRSGDSFGACHYTNTDKFCKLAKSKVSIEKINEILIVLQKDERLNAFVVELDDVQLLTKDGAIGEYKQYAKLSRNNKKIFHLIDIFNLIENEISFEKTRAKLIEYEEILNKEEDFGCLIEESDDLVELIKNYISKEDIANFLKVAKHNNLKYDFYLAENILRYALLSQKEDKISEKIEKFSKETFEIDCFGMHDVLNLIESNYSLDEIKYLISERFDSREILELSESEATQDYVKKMLLTGLRPYKIVDCAKKGVTLDYTKQMLDLGFEDSWIEYLYENKVTCEEVKALLEIKRDGKSFDLNDTINWLAKNKINPERVREISDLKYKGKYLCKENCISYLSRSNVSVDYIKELIKLKEEYSNFNFDPYDIKEAVRICVPIEYVKQILKITGKNKREISLTDIDLYFKFNLDPRNDFSFESFDPKPKCLFITPESNAGTFSNRDSIQFFKSLKNFYDIKFVTENKKQDIYVPIEQSRQNKQPINLMIISDHGWEEGLGPFDTSCPELEKYLNMLKQDAIIFLYSCATAKGGKENKNNFYNFVVERAGNRTVIASKLSFASEDLELKMNQLNKQNPFDVKIIIGYQDVTVKSDRKFYLFEYFK